MVVSPGVQALRDDFAVNASVRKRHYPASKRNEELIEEQLRVREREVRVPL